ncbi:MAG: hypothetical protein ABIA75_09620 [Candidatus Neomarinimicrobiota bacterium]
MDFISHGLWGGIALGRGNRRQFGLAALFSILPDIFSEGIMFTMVLLNLPGMPGLADGHPNITDFPHYAQIFYNLWHSLVVFAVVFGLVWLIRKKPLWIMLTWALHILIDIPTHSLELFPTPFLWPLADFKFDGIGWEHPAVLLTDIGLLFGVYLIWLYPKIVALTNKGRR